MSNRNSHIDHDDQPNFDLEGAINRWRRSLTSNRAFLGEDLDELETHLRDHVAALAVDGRDERAAFFLATDRLGSMGDLQSEYRKVAFGRSKRRQSFASLAGWSLAMTHNYLKTTIRSLARHKGFTVINVVGLAVGLAGCILIGFYVHDELAYDDFFTEPDRIYRLGGGTVGWPYGRILEAEYPEVERAVYMRSYPTYPIKQGDKLLYEKLLYADGGFLSTFGYPLAAGDAATALQAPYSIVLSTPLAEELFGEDKPAVGQSLTLGDSLRFAVTGVVDVPRRSHIQFDALMSFETLRAVSPEFYEAEMSGGWLDLNVITYLQLRPGVDASSFGDKIADLPRERAPEYLARWGSSYQLGLERADKIYLYSEAGNTIGPKSSIDYVYLLGAVGVFLLIIAGVNFINLTTARSVDRAKEVGVRKVVGSSRAPLVRQFLGESLVLCFLSLLVAIGLVFLALPGFNTLTAKSFAPADMITWQACVALLLVAVVVGLLAGLYPALSLSSFKPVEVLKGRFAAGRRGARLRSGLVVFQFAISGVLVLATLVVMSQLRYMQGRDLGFDGEQVLVIDTRRAPYAERQQLDDTFRDVIASHASVQSVSAMFAVPGRDAWRGQLSFPEGWDEGESISLEYLAVDFGFVETLGLEIIAGRDFDPDAGPDATDAVMINEAAVTAAGWASAQDAVGKRFTSPGSRKPNGVVIGVVKDYHHHGLQERIGPMMFGIRDGNGLVAVRVNASDAGPAVRHAEATWEQLFAGYPMELFFLDADFDAQYAQERRLMLVFMTFAMLTIFIACLGLFALAAYAAVQRTKEIGVRKVLGASSSTIAGLLVTDFVKWVVLAFALSIPVAYYGMTRWLEGFAYRAPIRIDIVLFGGVLLVLIAVITVGYTALRAASTQPARSLRYE